MIRNNLPKISVLIPAYNQKVYLKKAIDSVLIQDYANIEIIISDDCSNDGTDVMMLQYRDNNKVKYYRNEINVGINNSKILFYELSEGKYVLILNHDDYFISNNYLTRAITMMEENENINLVFANVITLTEATGESDLSDIDIAPITNGIEYFINYGSNHYPHIVGTLTTVFKREDAVRMGVLNENTVSRDLFRNLKLMLLGDVGFISDTVAVYRIHNASITFNYPEGYDLSTINEFEKLRLYAIALGIDRDTMDKWVQLRVYKYIEWRFTILWSQKKTKEALQLLLSIPEKYIFISLFFNRISFR